MFKFVIVCLALIAAAFANPIAKPATVYTSGVVASPYVSNFVAGRSLAVPTVGAYSAYPYSAYPYSYGYNGVAPVVSYV